MNVKTKMISGEYSSCATVSIDRCDFFFFILIEFAKAYFNRRINEVHIYTTNAIVSVH